MAHETGTRPDGPEIGVKIRELRLKRRYTLQDLSAKSGVTKAVLSQVESGDVVPAVAVLLKVARALETDISRLFLGEESERRIAVTRTSERKQLARRSHQDSSEVGYLYESLELHKPKKHMQPFLVTFDARDKKDMVFYSHKGEECVYVVDGELEFRTPDEMIALKPGDCLYFESDVAHAFRGLGDGAARALVIVYAGEEG